MNRRREVVLMLLLGALPAARVRAQATRLRRVGLLSIRSRPATMEGDVQYGAFLAGMRSLGYVEGVNVAYEWRFANGRYDTLSALAEDLVRSRVDVLVVVNVPVIRAAQQATRTIPIVMMTSSDPVGAGFVASLARPGGNITGLSNANLDLTTKHLELLRAIVPRLPTVGYLMSANNPSHAAGLNVLRADARIEVRPLRATSREEIERELTAAGKEISGLIVASETLFLENRRLIVERVQKLRLPAIYPQKTFVAEGGLMSYGQDFDLSYRKAASYVDKLLKGAHAADLPVEMGEALHLVINRNTASELGLRIPDSLLLRADEIIG